jgi:hypothetical protein
VLTSIPTIKRGHAAAPSHRFAAAKNITLRDASAARHVVVTLAANRRHAPRVLCSPRPPASAWRGKLSHRRIASRRRGQNSGFRALRARSRDRTPIITGPFIEGDRFAKWWQICSRGDEATPCGESIVWQGNHPPGRAQAAASQRAIGRPPGGQGLCWRICEKPLGALVDRGIARGGRWTKPGKSGQSPSKPWASGFDQRHALLQLLKDFC